MCILYEQLRPAPAGHPRPHRIWLHTVCDLIYCGNGHRLGAAAEGPQPATPHTQNSQEEEFDVLPWLEPGDSNPTTDYLCGRRAELRFTVRRPASAEVSPCCHRPSGGDVACSVLVGVARPRGAGLALENRLALTVFGREVPARGASLRGVRGRDLLDPTTSLVLQSRGEQTPSTPVNAPVEAALLGDPHTGPLDG